MDSDHYKAAFAFAEDLMFYLMRCKNLHWKINLSPIQSEFTEEIGEAVAKFSDKFSKTTELSQNPKVVDRDIFPGGYSAFRFLDYCGRLTSLALYQFKEDSNSVLPHYIVDKIAETLSFFMVGQDFCESGGWHGLHKVATHLVEALNFCSRA